MPSFAVTWDYRCPFARNAHEHVVTALEAGVGWEVRFVPFSLDQVDVERGQPDVWDDPRRAPALLATLVAIAVRDTFAEAFLPIHRALFAARHDQGRDLREEAVLRDVLTAAGLPAGAVLSEVADGWPLEAFRKEHEESVAEHAVFGVPTFVTATQAVFVRLMHRPHGDAEMATSTVERLLDLVDGWPELNELKHTSIRR